MSKKIKLEKFEGPMDLLLQLIEKEEMNITEISLSQVTEQYFNYLNTLENEHPEELADFLVIATKLVYLKSKNLLPYLYPEEEEGQSLADQLKMYKRYADAANFVQDLWTKNKVSYGRIEPPIKLAGFVMPFNATMGDLHEAFTLLLRRLKPSNPLPQVSIDHSISVKQKVESIFNAIKEWKKMDFRDILRTAESRTEVIASFLAVLELLKQEKISIHQEEAYENMVIKKI